MAGGKPRIAIPKRRQSEDKVDDKTIDEIIEDQRVKDAFNKRLQKWQKD